MTDDNFPKGVFTLGLRELAYVPRWTIARTSRKPSVAEHSYYVAQYADGIAELIEWKGDRLRLLQHALWHDADEMLTGDIPGPVKRGTRNNMRNTQYIRDAMIRHYGSSQAGYAEEFAIIKVADILEDIAFITGEIRMGNDWVRGILKSDRARLEAAIDRLPDMDDDIKLRSVRAVLFNFVDKVLWAEPILPE